MKTPFVFCLFLISFCVMSVTAQPALKGRFVDLVSNAPIAEVEVQITIGCFASHFNPMPGVKTVATLSNANGTFALKGEAPLSGCSASPLQAGFSIKKAGYHFRITADRLVYNDNEINLQDIRGTNLSPLTLLNAASYSGWSYDPDIRSIGVSQTITAVFGENLASHTVAAATTPLPTVLAGRRLTISDETGTERPAPLLFVSAGQINCIIPAGLGTGKLIVRLYEAERVIAAAFINLYTPISGIFSADASGRGWPAAIITRVKPGNIQSVEPVARYDSDTRQYVAVPIDLGPEGERMSLSLFGTGWRSIPMQDFSITIGGVEATVTYAGLQPTLAGLDQINVEVPRPLKGRGDVVVQVKYRISGYEVPFNPVSIKIQ